MRRALRAALVAAVLAALLQASASADLIEVKGKSMVTGKVVKETSDSVTFTDSWGKTVTYPRSDVVYLEKTNDSKKKFSKPKAKSKDKDGKDSGSDSPGLLSGLPFDFGELGEKDMATIMRDVLTLWSNFWSGDVEKSPEEVFNEAMDRARNIKKTVSGSDRMTQGICFAGMAIILIGMVGVTLFGWQLIFSAFEEGVLWGFMLIGAGLANFAPLVGGDLGLALMIPQAFVVYYIVTRWDNARNSVVNQILSLNLAFFGYLVMRTVS